METRKHLLPIVGGMLLLLLALHSCSPAKKSAVICTEFPAYKNSRSNHHGGKKIMLAIHPRKIKKHRHVSSAHIQLNNIVTEPESGNNGIAELRNLNKLEFSEGLLASSDNSLVPFRRSYSGSDELSRDIFSNVQNSKCDTIILRSGSVIYGKVEEIGQTEIKYRKCNNLSGPLISIAKTEVSSIRYTNGTGENLNAVIIQTPQTYSISAPPDNNYPRTNEGLGIAGFLASLVGLFIASIPLGLLAVIFCGISLKRIKRDPARYKGRGLAIAGIIIGIIDIVAMVILLATIPL